MTESIKLYVIAFVAFCALTFGLYVQHESIKQLTVSQAESIKLIKEQTDAIAELNKRTVAIQVLSAAASAAASEDRSALNYAIQKLPSAGARSTPQPIVDELCKRLSCVKRAPSVQPVHKAGS